MLVDIVARLRRTADDVTEANLETNSPEPKAVLDYLTWTRQSPAF